MHMDCIIQAYFFLFALIHGVGLRAVEDPWPTGDMLMNLKMAMQLTINNKKYRETQQKYRLGMVSD